MDNFPIRVIIDTDAGADDLLAIAYLMCLPDRVEIEAITVVHGLCHVPAGVLNIRRLLKLLGRSDTPVYHGEEYAIISRNEFLGEWREATDKLTGVRLPQLDSDDLSTSTSTSTSTSSSASASASTSTSIDSRYSTSASASASTSTSTSTSASTSDRIQSDAVAYLTRRLSSSSQPSPIRLLALGPLTNIALALRDIPHSHTALSDIILMGGAFEVPGNLLPGMNTTAEWNIFIDPHAASELFARPDIATFVVGLDATNSIPINRSFVDDFFEKEALMGVAGRFVGDVLRSHRLFIDQGLMYAWDTMAGMCVESSDCVRFRRASVSVLVSGEDEGRTVLEQWLDKECCLVQVPTTTTTTTTTTMDTTTATATATETTTATATATATTTDTTVFASVPTSAPAAAAVGASSSGKGVFIGISGDAHYFYDRFIQSLLNHSDR